MKSITWRNKMFFSCYSNFMYFLLLPKRMVHCYHCPPLVGENSNFPVQKPLLLQKNKMSFGCNLSTSLNVSLEYKRYLGKIWINHLFLVSYKMLCGYNRFWEVKYRSTVISINTFLLVKNNMAIGNNPNQFLSSRK